MKNKRDIRIRTSHGGIGGPVVSENFDINKEDLYEIAKIVARVTIAEYTNFLITIHNKKEPDA